MSTETVPNDRRAAEYLANERTFLAWLRTSIAILSLGFALAKFSLWMRDLGLEIHRPFRGPETAVPMGEALMAFGGLLSLSDRRLRVGAPKPAKAARGLQAAE